MHTHETAGDRCAEKKKAACGTATFSENSRELKPEANTIETGARGVKGNLLLAVRVRIADLQRIARGRLNDRGFDWRKFADFVCNEMLAAAPGEHVDHHSEIDVIDRPFDRTTVTKTRTRRITWPTPCAATVLCYGRHRLFETIDQAPPAIVADVEAGVADALAPGRRIRFSGDDIGRALGITAEEKLAAKAWQIGAVDVSAEEWAEIIRKRRADQQRRRRRKQGLAPHDDSIAAMARAAGIRPDTMRARLRRARMKAENGAEQHVAKMRPRKKKKDREASFSRQRSATADSVRTCDKTPSQNRNPPLRPSGAESGEGFGRVEKPISADARKIFSERREMREPGRVASPMLSAAATIDHALATSLTSSLAEACQ